MTVKANEEMPDWLEPMAATLTQERFAGDEWLFERKFDGIRLLAYKRGADVEALLAQPASAGSARPSRSAVARLPVHDVILDGEVTWEARAAITSSTSCG